MSWGLKAKKMKGKKCDVVIFIFFFPIMYFVNCYSMISYSNILE